MSDATTPTHVGIGWQIGVPSGWGTYGVNLAVELARRGITPELFFLAKSLNLPPTQQDVLSAALAKQHDWFAAFQRGPVDLDFPMLHALGDKLDFPDLARGIKGKPNVGVVFFESATVPDENLAAVSDFALIVTGSSWNADVLRAHGLTNVSNCPQGIDPTIFSPGQKSDRFGDRFAVFSGGKLEYRKGQDLVVAAFKIFQQRHSDALLVSAWHNPWPEAAKSVGLSPHVDVAPGTDSEGRLDVGAWLKDCGLPLTSFVDIGPLANSETAQVLHDIDLAVFPNRCEGGTNLVAMECMACGVPVVLSRNTGHLDLIEADNCYALDFQIPMGEVTGRADLEGWGESSIEELVAKMEDAYENRDDSLRRGAAAAASMRAWTWEMQTGRLVNALGKIC
jgi:glycosyltransferase involved in cell wall biosynthesis